MKLSAFPESFLSKMSPEDRRAIGQITASEAQESYNRGQEKDLKRDVTRWLSLQGCWIFEQGMHRRTGGRCGTPDVLACVPPGGRFLAVELKVAGGRLGAAQAAEIERVRGAGGIAVIAYSLADVMCAFQKVRK